jgi:uncharacterized RDD family membrane protein YckC
MSDVAATRSLVTPEGVDLKLRIASAGDRAAAFIVDALILIGCLIGLTILAFMAFAAAVRLGVKGFTGELQVIAIIWLLGAFLLRNAWFIAFELGPRAATPGKRAMGIRVAARHGGALTAEAVFARNALREIEVWLPLSFLLSRGGGAGVNGWIVLAGLMWTGVFVFFPLFNRDRLRAGDLVAGTWVVKAPKARLLRDLSVEAASTGFAFTPAQVQAYGVKELHVLEQVLRAKDRKVMAAVADRIRAKIAWTAAPDESDLAFLGAYYAALRARLEHRLLFGHRRKDKFDAV